MCQSVYLEHDTCTCIYIAANFIPCEAYSLAHPEDVSDPPSPSPDPAGYTPDLEDPFAEQKDPFADPADPVDPFADPKDPFADPDSASDTPLLARALRPKLLVRTHRGLDITHEDLDFVSLDVDGSWAPKGLQCPTGKIEAIRGQRDKDEKRACPLCERPEVSGMLEQMRLPGGGEEGRPDSLKAWLEGAEKEKKGKGKEKGGNAAQIKTAAIKFFKGAGVDKGKKTECIGVGYDEVGEGGSSKGKEAEKRAAERRKKENKEREKRKKKEIKEADRRMEGEEEYVSWEP